MNIDYKLLIPIVVLQAIFSIYCIIIIAKNPVKLMPKWLWGILCLNTLGCVVFLILGKDEE